MWHTSCAFSRGWTPSKHPSACFATCRSPRSRRRPPRKIHAHRLPYGSERRRAAEKERVSAQRRPAPRSGGREKMADDGGTLTDAPNFTCVSTCSTLLHYGSSCMIPYAPQYLSISVSRPEALSPDSTLYLPTFSHSGLLIVNKLLSLSASSLLSPPPLSPDGHFLVMTQ